MKESSNDREGSVYEDSGLSNDEEEVVQLQAVRPVVAKSPHLHHADDDSQAGQAVDGQLGESGHLDGQLSQSDLLVIDEDEEDNERDNGDDENDDATKEPRAGLAAVNAVPSSLCRLSRPQLTT